MAKSSEPVEPDRFTTALKFEVNDRELLLTEWVIHPVGEGAKFKTKPNLSSDTQQVFGPALLAVFGRYLLLPESVSTSKIALKVYLSELFCDRLANFSASTTKRKNSWASISDTHRGYAHLLLPVSSGQVSLEGGKLGQTVVTLEVTSGGVSETFTHESLRGESNRRRLRELLDEHAPLPPATRNDLKYDVTFPTKPRNGVPAWLARGDYHFFKTMFSFTLPAARVENEFCLGLLTGHDVLPDSIRNPNVLYREVIGINKTVNSAEYTALLKAAKEARDKNNENSASECAQCLEPLFELGVKVDGQVVQLASVDWSGDDPNEILFCYRVPPAASDLVKRAFEFCVHGVQPYEYQSFPMIISRPTWKGEFTFNYDPSEISSVRYFIGLANAIDKKNVNKHSTERQYSVDDKPDKRFLKIKLEEDQEDVWQPGEGVLVHWTWKRNDANFVRLEPGAGLRLEPRLPRVTESDSRNLYRAQHLFLIDKVRDDLLKVIKDLGTNNFGLIVWDAYRPASVHEQLLEQTKKTEQPINLSPLTIGSIHSRGCAVDVWLFDTATGATDESVPHPDGQRGKAPENDEDAARAASACAMLKAAMQNRGFESHNEFWWHFTHSAWRAYPRVDLNYHALPLSAEPTPDPRPEGSSDGVTQ